MNYMYFAKVVMRVFIGSVRISLMALFIMSVSHILVEVAVRCDESTPIRAS